MIHKARVFLINTGKMLPFFLCFIVFISYSENLISLIAENYVYYDGVYVLNKPMSWFIGQYFEYNLQMLAVLVIISIAIQTCIWNKIGCCYLGVNLFEKSWFSEHEYDNEIYYIVSILNMIICTYLCYKGIKQLTKTKYGD